MTQQFDELALKVVRSMDGISLDLSTQSFFVEYARRLREEWVKGLEPVAWMYPQGTLNVIGDKSVATPLYTLEGLK